jgi:hypothetical protein
MSLMCVVEALRSKTSVPSFWSAAGVFNPEECVYRLRLTLLERQVVIATDSPAISEVFTHVFSSRYFAPRPAGPVISFYCSTHCEAPWAVVFSTPSTRHMGRPSANDPMGFDQFRVSAGAIERAGSFACNDASRAGLRDAIVELFASQFVYLVLGDLLYHTPYTRIVHAASLTWGGAGLLLLAPTRGGKSTLAVAGVLSGMKLLSDDLSLVNLTGGELLPFPRALRLRKGTCDMLPEAAAKFTRSHRAAGLDKSGEIRYYVCPERIRGDVLGTVARLTHIVKVSGFADRPSLSAASPGAMAVSCLQADCFETKHRVMDLLWRWVALMKGMACADLTAGSPMETVRVLRSFVERKPNGQA